MTFGFLSRSGSKLARAEVFHAGLLDLRLETQPKRLVLIVDPCVNALQLLGYSLDALALDQ